MRMCSKARACAIRQNWAEIPKTSDLSSFVLQAQNMVSSDEGSPDYPREGRRTSNTAGPVWRGWTLL